MTAAYSLLFYALHENWTRWDREPNTVYVFFLLFLGRVSLSPFSHAVSQSVGRSFTLHDTFMPSYCWSTLSVALHVDALHVPKLYVPTHVYWHERDYPTWYVHSSTFYASNILTLTHNDCNNNIEKSHSPILATNYSFYSFLFCSSQSKYMVHEYLTHSTQHIIVERGSWWNAQWMYFPFVSIRHRNEFPLPFLSGESLRSWEYCARNSHWCRRHIFMGCINCCICHAYLE